MCAEMRRHPIKGMNSRARSGGFVWLRGIAVTGAPLTGRHLKPKERPRDNGKQQQERKTKRTKR